MAVPPCVFASSSSVYGPDAPLPAEESAPANPCSPYALTKLHGAVGRDGLGAPTCPPEWVAREHGAAPANDIPPSGAVWVSRGRPTLPPANTACASPPCGYSRCGISAGEQKCQRPDLALESFRRRIEAGQPIIINGDGSQRRDMTHVADVARAVGLAVRWQGPGSAVLNVGTGQNHSVLDMLAAAAQSAAPQVEFQAPHPADVPETLASITAVGIQLGWQPRISFPDGPDP